MEKGRAVQSLLVSNESQYLSHFSSFFQELWKNSIYARERVAEIEEGIEPSSIEIIKKPKDAIRHIHNLIGLAKYEILRKYPSISQFRHHIRLGVLKFFEGTLNRGISIRILVPGEIGQINELLKVRISLPRLEVRSLEESLRTHMGILVVDRIKSVKIELKDDTKDNYYDAAGLAAFSYSKLIAMSYASIFETLWKFEELYEQLKTYKIMKRVH